MYRNPEIAVALRRVAVEGRSGFYEGEMARQLVQALNKGGHPTTMADFAAFQPQWKRPLCTEYRGFVVLSAPPPQTGLQLLHTLNLLEPHNLRALGYPTQSAEAFDVVASAIRVANNDNRVNSDPNWGSVPAATVASKGFAETRRSLVGTGKVVTQIPRAADSVMRTPANPPSPGCAPLDPFGNESATTTGGFSGPEPAAPNAADAGETTHLSVVDADGNAVALTQTNSTTFGAGATVSGFLLNDSGMDLSRGGADATGRNPWRIRNSTVAPTIVLKDGRVQLVLGAPGGGRIQAAILQTMVYVLDYELDPLDAVRMPRIYPGAGPVVETENGFNAMVLGRVRAMGYVPTPDAVGYARMYVIARKGNRWIGAADPRHNGEVRGY
jgi:gamma-glutamyltranspeptidase/glutathione hydrolase